MATTILPLQGIRVLDLSRVLVGPFATQMLADLGAEVIKIERPDVGDDARHYGPPFFESEEKGRASAFFISVNRNKKSIALDISTADGQGKIKKLLSTCDVLVENFKSGDLKRYSLDYESVSASNEDLIYCSITGFGQTGPDRERPGYDLIFQALSGLMDITGHPDGAEGGGPMKVGMGLSDVVGAQYAVNAILAALMARERGVARGQHIDLSILDCMLGFLSHQASHYLISGQSPVRRGTEGTGGAPSGSFQTSNGIIVLTAGNDPQFARLCTILDLGNLAHRPEYSRNPMRVQNRDHLHAMISAKLSEMTTQAALEKLHAAGIPAAPINSIGDALEQARLSGRGMVLGGDENRPPMIANPIRFSATPLTRYDLPPALGQHSQEVLCWSMEQGYAET